MTGTRDEEPAGKQHATSTPSVQRAFLKQGDLLATGQETKVASSGKSSVRHANPSSENEDVGAHHTADGGTEVDPWAAGHVHDPWVHDDDEHPLGPTDDLSYNDGVRHEMGPQRDGGDDHWRDPAAPKEGDPAVEDESELKSEEEAAQSESTP